MPAVLLDEFESITAPRIKDTSTANVRILPRLRRALNSKNWRFAQKLFDRHWPQTKERSADFLRLASSLKREYKEKGPHVLELTTAYGKLGIVVAFGADAVKAAREHLTAKIPTFHIIELLNLADGNYKKGAK